MVATEVYLSIRNTDLFLRWTKHTYWKVWKSSAQRSHKTNRCFRPLPPHEKCVQKFSLYSLYVKVHIHDTLVDTRISSQLFFLGIRQRKTVYIILARKCSWVVELQHRYTKNYKDRPTDFFTAWFVSCQKTRSYYKNGDINEVADLHFLSCPFRILNNIARESSENCENNLETLSQATPSFSKCKYK